MQKVSILCTKNADMLLFTTNIGIAAYTPECSIYAETICECCLYFTYADRYVDISYYFKYFKYAKG